ncbi:Folylpolyglutamate synthase [Posidoniimonas polymericola]|uniref:Dihydrofolate synthase/folylpolyglutamate synthase n=1 Tax=Posidoniimonas polymericola TaxID=2528002 RepID=A0A5C5YUD8_9BACT|nr:folylpolyglutamate synthase/dihydrofolate synthase family protein [Posidoniimonas polymericola]TWT78283.1 Folylpolyglutamate synthase [Posidoniimonas polymericola]
MEPAPPTTRRDAAIDWLLGRINYERVAVIPYQERQLKLDRMRQLLTRLGSPDAGMRIVHIAGTKGKGSVAKMTAAMLTAAGYRTGVYSSPHLERFEERIAVDGLPCPAEDLVGLVERLRPVVDAMDQECGDPSEGPTFFDIATAMALVHFADRRCDAVVLEVGLGGRLDSTNVCLPVVSVITSISLDHTKQLGDTLGQIAGEKAGIAKPGVPLISGVTQDEPRGVITDAARQLGCRLLEIEYEFGFDYQSEKNSPKFSFWQADGDRRIEHAPQRLGPRGRHQAHNAAVALAVIGELRDQGWSIAADACREALAKLQLPGRVEIFPGEPTMIIDTAHNEASARALTEALAELDWGGEGILVLAASRDKDTQAICRELAPAFDRVFITRYLENPRAVDPQTLAAQYGEAAQDRAEVSVVETPGEALAAALAAAGPHDLVCVTGSFFIAAELRPLVAARGEKR